MVYVVFIVTKQGVETWKAACGCVYKVSRTQGVFSVQTI